MAVFLQNDVQVTVNSVDLTDHVASVTWTESAAELETTAMGDSNVTRIGGLKDGSVSIEFHQDFAASSVYATLYPLLGTTTTVELTPTSSAVAADNPKHSASALVTELPVLDGSVSDLATVSVTWPLSGAVTVSTS
ncbi:MAG: radical SAM protein [Actinomycetales bacterium]|nr:radical SAM protein [Actinomycetales bacterium]MCP4894936.1 radical SAM protein [Actinomycetales bacterium]